MGDPVVFLSVVSASWCLFLSLPQVDSQVWLTAVLTDFPYLWCCPLVNRYTFPHTQVHKSILAASWIISQLSISKQVNKLGFSMDGLASWYMARPHRIFSLTSKRVHSCKSTLTHLILIEKLGPTGCCIFKMRAVVGVSRNDLQMFDLIPESTISRCLQASYSVKAYPYLCS